jgi:hypothetical protein
VAARGNTQQFASILGSYSPTNTPLTGQVLSVLKAYFDGSGKDDNPECRFVTIAGFAAEDDIWAYFESEWRKILMDRGNPGHLHMHKAIQHKVAPYAGWGAAKVQFLVQGLIGLLREVNADPKFCSFYVTVDLDAHRKYAAKNNIPPVAQLCANMAFARMLIWYGQTSGLMTNIDLFFDRGDPFLNVLMQQWNSREIKQKYPWWRLVRTIAPVDSASTPGVQAADMLAWSHNRLKVSGADGWAGGIATEIIESAEVWGCDLDEGILAKRKFRNRHGFYT